MAQQQTLTFPGRPDAIAGQIRGYRSTQRRESSATAAWSQETLSLAAAELRILGTDEAEETIASLIELCRLVKSDEFVILDLARLTGRGGGDVHLHTADALHGMISRVCLRVGQHAPEIVSERRNYRTDLRVRLAQFTTELDTQDRTSQIIPLDRG